MSKCVPKRVLEVSRTAKSSVTPRTVLEPRLSRFRRDQEPGEWTASQLRHVEVRSVPASDVVASKIESLPRSFAFRWEGSVKTTLQGVFAKLQRAARVSRFTRMRERLAKLSQGPVRSSLVRPSQLRPSLVRPSLLRSVASPVRVLRQSLRSVPPIEMFQSVASKSVPVSQRQ